MEQFKILHVKHKSLIRSLIQKLFLKFLLKLFPKKFLFYKNKIKFIMNRSRFYIHFCLMSIYLRFRYPLYYSLPFTQIYALYMAIKFLKILKPQKIDFFLLEGCLLGAVRQESFAGRPTDIDLGIREEQFQKLLDSIPLLIKDGAEIIRRYSRNKSKRLQIVYSRVLIDIAVYSKKNVGKDEVWIGEFDNLINQKFDGITFPIADLEHLITIKAYDKEFMAPANPEVYLEKVYGKNWRTPDKKQFFWNKNKFKQNYHYH